MAARVAVPKAWPEELFPKNGAPRDARDSVHHKTSQDFARVGRQRLWSNFSSHCLLPNESPRQGPGSCPEQAAWSSRMCRIIFAAKPVQYHVQVQGRSLGKFPLGFDKKNPKTILHKPKQFHVPGPCSRCLESGTVERDGALWVATQSDAGRHERCHWRCQLPRELRTKIEHTHTHTARGQLTHTRRKAHRRVDWAFKIHAT